MKVTEKIIFTQYKEELSSSAKYWNRLLHEVIGSIPPNAEYQGFCGGTNFGWDISGFKFWVCCFLHYDVGKAIEPT